jgi:hypothetical protein
MRRFQFSLRTFLLGFTAFTVLSALTLQWWLRPYALTGSYDNGNRAWEQWERRGLTGGIVHIKTIRFYPSGGKCIEYKKGGGIQYFAPDGTTVQEQEWNTKYAGDIMPDVRRDPNSRRPWPNE